MIAPDLSSQFLLIVVLFLCSGLSTCFFVYNRWKLDVITPGKRLVRLITIFILTVIFLITLQFTFKQSFEIWLVIYTVTMTIIAFGDFISLRLKTK